MRSSVAVPPVRLEVGTVRAVGLLLVLIMLGAGCHTTPARDDFSRRLVELADDEPGTFEFFFVTSRERGVHGLRDEGRTPPTYGVFRAHISPQLRVGVEGSVDAWRHRGLLRITEVVELPREDFAARLRTAVRASPHDSLLLTVWGFRERFETAAMKTAFTAWALDINTPVLLCDWPADAGLAPAAYLNARGRAADAGEALAPFLVTLTRDPAPRRLWVVAHSLGCQVVCDAFSHLAREPDLVDADAEFEHVIFAAPDVAQDEFDEKFREEIRVLSRRLTTYVSSNDLALLLSEWVTRRRRIGRAVADEPQQLEEMMDLLALQEEGAKGVFVVDVTPVNAGRAGHGFIIDSADVCDDLFVRLVADAIPVSRRLYPVRASSGVTHWILWGQD